MLIVGQQIIELAVYTKLEQCGAAPRSMGELERNLAICDGVVAEGVAGTGKSYVEQALLRIFALWSKHPLSPGCALGLIALSAWQTSVVDGIHAAVPVRGGACAQVHRVRARRR